MHRHSQAGQVLVAMMIFMLIIITLTSAAIAVTVINLQASGSFAIGDQALAYADSGAEDALEELIKNTSYAGGTMTLSYGTVTITVSGSATAKTIVSQGVSGSFTRTATVNATITNGVLTVTSWSISP